MNVSTSDKDLPTVPHELLWSSRPRAKQFSENTYIELLEGENEQLRLQNKELQRQIAILEGKNNIEVELKRKSEERVIRCDDAIRRRDKVIEEIAKAIASEFQRYKDLTNEITSDDVIVYSHFKSGSPF